ncbi:MAG: thioredoxin domain-containing protein [Deltaproteobacteria bacterium]
MRPFLPIATLVLGVVLGVVGDRVIASPRPVRAPAPAPIAAAPAVPAAPAAPAAARLPGDTANVPLRTDDPVRGTAGAKVTVVVFSDFQCPFCSKVEPAMARLLEANPGAVRVVWKHQPLSMHPNAVPAARAAEAARLQGKFWEMHDRLFANQASLSDTLYAQAARELGLDLARFQSDAASQAVLARIAADQMLAGSVGAQGTPTLFLNCRKVVGAQPVEAFQAVVTEEIGKADALLSRGVKPADLYAQLCSDNVKAGARLAEAAARGAGAITVRADDPIRGGRKAPVTVIEFSDFQCPYCARAVPAVKELEGNKNVRVVWKHLPLSFHPNAMPAALAAEAAREQGRFWEMHDKLFANQAGLSEATYLAYARELGLDLKRFQEAMQSPRTRARVQEDLAAAGDAGVTGTPTFVVNGEVVVGSGGLAAAVKRRLAASR